MKLKIKISNLCCFFFLILLCNCVQSSASLFGPVMTGAKTGSVYQTGFSYASSKIIKSQLGEEPSDYIKKILNKKSYTSKSYPNFNEDHFYESKKLSLNKEFSKIEYDEFLSSVKKMLK